MSFKNILMSLLISSLSFNALANSHETARYWIALGTVAHQCGRVSQYKVNITNEDIGITASRESGLNRSQVINILGNKNQKRMIASKVSAIKAEISRGDASCADIILAFSSSFMR